MRYNLWAFRHTKLLAAARASGVLVMVEAHPPNSDSCRTPTTKSIRTQVVHTRAPQGEFRGLLQHFVIKKKVKTNCVFQKRPHIKCRGPHHLAIPGAQALRPYLRGRARSHPGSRGLLLHERLHVPAQDAARDI